MPDVSKRKTRLKGEDFKVPKRISGDCFAELFTTFKIPLKNRENLKQLLESLIEELTSRLREERQKPHRSADGNHLKAIQENLAEVAKHVQKLVT